MNHDLLCPMHPSWHEGWDGNEKCFCNLIAKVRADERHRVVGIGYDMGEAETRDNLRAKVEALPPHRARPSLWVRRVHVLELIDGGSDD